MARRLLVDVERCTECHSCELRCSFVHFGTFNRNKSGVRIVARWPSWPVASVCRQCEDPACMSACPADAIVRVGSGAMHIVNDDCIGCGSCVDACPYGGIWMDPLANVAVKCDTCDGLFSCVAECLAGALSISE